MRLARPWPAPWGRPDDAVPPGTYRHVKGGRYQVLGMVFAADGKAEGDAAVVYRPLYPVPGLPVAVRSLAGWQAPADGGRIRFAPESPEERLAAVTVGALEPGVITLVEPDPDWAAAYAGHERRLRSALGARVRRIEHIGSTSVPGLIAKQVIDVLLVVDDPADEEAWLPDLVAAGYELRIREPEHDDHRLVRPVERGANIHVLPPWSVEVERYLLLRNRLRTHPDEREGYAALKRRLVEQQWAAVNDYADAKGDLIEAVIARARGEGTTVHGV